MATGCEFTWPAETLGYSSGQGVLSTSGITRSGRSAISGRPSTSGVELRPIFWGSLFGVERACWTTGTWRCCLSLHVVSSIPIWCTTIFQLLCGLYECSLTRASRLKQQTCMYMYVAMVCMWYVYYFVWRKLENMSLCSGSRVNTNYERIASWGGCQYWTGNPSILETPLAAHCSSQHLNHSTMTHPSKWIGTSWVPVVSHIGYSIWHWRIDIILYEGNTRTCLRALAAGQIPIMSELLHEVDTSVEPGIWETPLVAHMWYVYVCMYVWMDGCMQVYIQINQMR